MKTVVYQSYRTTRVPDWIEACIASVRSWAAANGFDYRFIDDSFLELVPPWFRERCAGEICPVTDLARLVMGRRLLDAGYERVVWADADMLVFAPEALRVDVPTGFAFCLERWAAPDAAGGLQHAGQINNSIAVFTRQGPQLDFFIDAALRIAAAKPRVHKLEIGTHFLTGLGQLMPLPLLLNVGTFSPVLMRSIASGEERLLAAYGAALPAPLASANLCSSLVGQAVQGHAAELSTYEAVVETCLRTRGAVVNRHVRTGP